MNSFFNILIGCLISSIGISVFLLPNQLSTGGFSGIATITYYLFNIPMGMMNLILNIPMFIFSNYRIGKKFLIKSIVGTASLSVFIDIFDKYPAITNDRFLECIYGGGGNLNILSQCDKGYKAGGQSVTCKCGYKVFLPTP